MKYPLPLPPYQNQRVFQILLLQLTLFLIHQLHQNLIPNPNLFQYLQRELELLPLVILKLHHSLLSKLQKLNQLLQHTPFPLPFPIPFPLIIQILSTLLQLWCPQLPQSQYLHLVILLLLYLTLGPDRVQQRSRHLHRLNLPPTLIFRIGWYYQ